jgi:hypothetical protein
MVIGAENEIWLRETHPGLRADENGVSGTIEFRATYDGGANYFVVLPRGLSSRVSGVVLHCKRPIRIIARKDKSLSELPMLFVDDIKNPDAARHFCTDGAACLGSPFLETKYLQPMFQFQAFMLELVHPFLYCQEYFDRFARWPWRAREHGALGLLESCLDIDLAETPHVLKKFAAQFGWDQVRELLERPTIGRDTRCLSCRGPMCRCHDIAFSGLQRLHQAVRDKGLQLP